MDAKVCVWFILCEGREVFGFVGDVSRLDICVECVQLDFGFIGTSCDGVF